MKTFMRAMTALLLIFFFSNGETFGKASSSPLELTVRDVIKLVKEKNERIFFQELEWGVRKDAIKAERAIFEPDFVSSYQHEKNNVRSTLEEFIERSSGIFQGVDPSTYDERNNYYNLGVEGLTPIGTRVRLAYTLNDISTNQSDAVAPGISQYQTSFGGNLEQPLLKNRGINATMASIRIAEADADVAFHAYRQEMMNVIFNAASAYWDLYLAQEKRQVRLDSVRIAEQLLKDNRERAKFGRIAETEVLEAEAGLAFRKSLEISAEQELVSSINTVRTYFSSSAANEDIPIKAVDRLELKEVMADLNRSLKTALKFRPEYLSSIRKTEREGIRIAYAENQRWPQLDLMASYGINGLADSPRDSWSDAKDFDFESWAVGLQLRIPIGGGKKTLSDLEAAKKKKRQALLEVKAVEVAVANATDTAVQNFHSAYDQVLQHDKAVRLNERLLKVEVARFDAGKSTSRILLEREEDLNRAKEAKLESLVNYKKSELSLEMTQGTLLMAHGIEIMEVKK